MLQSDDERRTAIRRAGEQIRQRVHDQNRATLTLIYRMNLPGLDVDLLDAALAPLLSPVDWLVEEFVTTVEAAMVAVRSAGAAATSATLRWSGR